MTEANVIQFVSKESRRQLEAMLRAMAHEEIEQRALDTALANLTQYPVMQDDQAPDLSAKELNDLLGRLLPEGTDEFIFKGRFEELFEGAEPIRDDKVVDLGMFRKMLSL